MWIKRTFWIAYNMCCLLVLERHTGCVVAARAVSIEYTEWPTPVTLPAVAETLKDLFEGLCVLGLERTVGGRGVKKMFDSLCV